MFVILNKFDRLIDEHLSDDVSCSIIDFVGDSRPKIDQSRDEQLIFVWWKTILRLSSVPSDSVRSKLVEFVPRLFVDRTSFDATLGRNLFLGQQVLFESIVDRMIEQTSTIDQSIELFDQLFVDLLAGNNDESEEKLIDVRSWPCAEGYNNVFVSDCDNWDLFSVRHGFLLVEAMNKLRSISVRGETFRGKNVDQLRCQLKLLSDDQTRLEESLSIRRLSFVRTFLLEKYVLSFDSPISRPTDERPFRSFSTLR